MSHCLAIDRNLEDCRRHRIGETQFCNLHQYMSQYSEEMIANQTICSTCRKAYYLEDGRKVCDGCRERSKMNAIKIREQVILCGKTGCNFKKSEENNYCNKHQLCIFEDETKEMNKKLCYNVIRGCRSQLEMDYKCSKCPDCLEIERAKDHKRRNKAKEQYKEDALENSIRESKLCTICCIERPMEMFIGIATSETKSCKICRDDNKRQDLKRDKEHRNELARTNSLNIERKKVKKTWKESNYDKIALCWMNYRERQIQKLGIHEYLKNNAYKSKKWRENNQLKVKEINENTKKSLRPQYQIYIINANNKNVPFNITFEDYTTIVKNPCYYCGILQDRGFNGIDRMNSKVGYILHNCVSCCKMCNYMKASISVDVFIKRVEHILSYQNIISGNLYPECFPNHKCSPYNAYKYRSLKKQIEFLITKEEYEKIIQKNCFLCGKQSDENNVNGIDRMDSNKGYVIDNINACCGDCNYMKKTYEYCDLIKKFVSIYDTYKNKHNNTFINDNITLLCHENKGENELENQHMKKNRIKKTKEEINEINRIYKLQQCENLKEKYGNQEYKLRRAKEIAELRLHKS